MRRVRVNVRAANVSKPREAMRNGRKVVIVPSATLPDNVVMNGIRYPADEIERSYMTLNRSPAPLGHPIVNGQFVSASDPEGINIGWIGAWNENVRREGGRVLLDKVIDIEVAERTDAGKRVLAAINAGDPVHTSTGLLCNLEPVNEGDAKFVARNILFDHDAILLDEVGAATPEQGVGMLVNGEQIEVINSALDDAECDLDRAVDHLAHALERRARAPMLERIKAAAAGLFALPARETSDREDVSMAEDKQLDALSAKVESLAEAMNNIDETVARAIKPLADELATIKANAKAAEDAEKASLVSKIVKANLLSEDAARELTLNAARELAAKAVPGKAAAINGAFAGGIEDEFAGFDMNALHKEVN